MKCKFLSVLCLAAVMVSMLLAGCAGAPGAFSSAASSAVSPSAAEASSAAPAPQVSSVAASSAPASASAPQDGWRVLSGQEAADLWDSFGAGDVLFDGTQHLWISPDSESNKIGISFSKTNRESDPQLAQKPAMGIGIAYTDAGSWYMVEQVTTDDNGRYHIAFSNVWNQEEIDGEPAMILGPLEESDPTAAVFDLGEPGDGKMELVTFEPADCALNNGPDVMPGMLQLS